MVKIKEIKDVERFGDEIYLRELIEVIIGYIYENEYYKPLKRNMMHKNLYRSLVVIEQDIVNQGLKRKEYKKGSIKMTSMRRKLKDLVYDIIELVEASKWYKDIAIDMFGEPLDMSGYVEFSIYKSIQDFYNIVKIINSYKEIKDAKNKE